MRSFYTGFDFIMAQAVAFQATLQRIGFSQAATLAIANNGITTAQDLVGLDDKDVEQILKIVRTGPPPVPAPYIAQTFKHNVLLGYKTKPLK
jgi:hypothetical protein